MESPPRDTENDCGTLGMRRRDEVLSVCYKRLDETTASRQYTDLFSDMDRTCPRFPAARSISYTATVKKRGEERQIEVDDMQNVAHRTPVPRAVVEAMVIMMGHFSSQKTHSATSRSL